MYIFDYNKHDHFYPIRVSKTVNRDSPDEGERKGFSAGKRQHESCRVIYPITSWAQSKPLVGKTDVDISCYKVSVISTTVQAVVRGKYQADQEEMGYGESECQEKG